MIKDNQWEHLVITIAILIPAFLLGLAVPAACLTIGLFAGREHAQAEYRWIEHYGSGLRTNMPWWGGFDPKVWDVHSWWWNLLLPCLAAVALVSLANI